MTFNRWLFQQGETPQHFDCVLANITADFNKNPMVVSFLSAPFSGSMWYCMRRDGFWVPLEDEGIEPPGEYLIQLLLIK